MALQNVAAASFHLVALLCISTSANAQSLAWKGVSTTYQGASSIIAGDVHRRLPGVLDAGTPVLLLLVDMACAPTEDAYWSRLQQQVAHTRKLNGYKLVIVGNSRDQKARQALMKISNAMRADWAGCSREAKLSASKSACEFVVIDALGAVLKRVDPDSPSGLKSLVRASHHHALLKARFSRIRTALGLYGDRPLIFYRCPTANPGGSLDALSRYISPYAFSGMTLVVCAPKSRADSLGKKLKQILPEVASTVVIDEMLDDRLGKTIAKGHLFTIGVRDDSALCVSWDVSQSKAQHLLKSFLQEAVAVARVEKVLERVRVRKYQRQSPHPLTRSILAWEDIPALLKFAHDDTPIRKPTRPGSSLFDIKFHIETGVVALWLIESIRVDDDYPTPHILYDHLRDPFRKQRLDAYFAWWARASRLPRDDARRIDPASMGSFGASWGNSNGFIDLKPPAEHK